MSFLSNLEWRRAEKTFSRSSENENIVNIAKVMNAMIQAPSSFGVQPYHIVAVQSDDVKQKLLEASYGQKQVVECDTLFILCTRSNLTERIEQYITEATVPPPYDDFMRNSLKGNDTNWSARQAYIALGFGLAACAELKLASCPMEGFDSEKVKQLLELPDTLQPCVYLAVGNKSDTPSPFPRFRFSEKDMITRM
jgi:nitroreductase